MARRFAFVWWVAAALLAGCAGGSHSVPPVSSSNAGRDAAKNVAVSFSIAVPVARQTSQNRRLTYVSSGTKSASLGVAAGAGTPTAAQTVTVNCTTVCAGTVLAPIGSDTFVAKLFGAASGTGALLSTGTAIQTIATGVNTVHLTFNPVVASVTLALDTSALPDNQPGTAQLNVTAKDPAGASIVGPGSYVDGNGQPLTISIASTAVSNTKVSPTPTQFAAPQTATGASNVATITFTPPGHFQFPTFTVANPGLPSEPAGGVTLLYEPVTVDDATNDFSVSYPPSVGGDFIPLLAEDTEDIVQISNNALFSVNPDHNGVTLGYGSDKQIYFAYAPVAASPAFDTIVFGRLDQTNEALSPKSPPLPFSSLLGLGDTAYGNGMTLGNDGNLWFGGTANGLGIIGKLSTAGAGSAAPTPTVFPIVGSKSILAFGPGLGNNEVFLYRSASDSTVHVATISAGLSGLATDHQISDQSPFGTTDPENVGDLLIAADGSVYLSAATTFSSNVYRIAVDGTLSLVPNCQSISGKVFRLPDGTGVGTASSLTPGGLDVYMHVVPGSGCMPVPAANGASATVFEAIDATTATWYYFHNPNGHRRGVF